MYSNMSVCEDPLSTLAALQPQECPASAGTSSKLPLCLPPVFRLGVMGHYYSVYVVVLPQPQKCDSWGTRNLASPWWFRGTLPSCQEFGGLWCRTLVAGFRPFDRDRYAISNQHI